MYAKGGSGTTDWSAVRLGLGTMKSLPIVGAVADAIDAESAVEQAERFRTYLAGKFPNQDVRLLLSPTEMLTPSFLADLRRLAARRPVALFFDTFERTAPWCETWLLDLFGGRYGALPARRQLARLRLGSHQALAGRSGGCRRGLPAGVRPGSSRGGGR
ncbi:hypothetical protein [Nonomuraea cavernae]|uniref:Uncharacterized protein n=1 Tax=Nonomuraea cavernae TaxID=2045107 RepID=A0A917ZAS9_9ACTN|nr:hypothetical protein [Nonomuraea cavernae]MCA2190440.1 hypothetical protein [Nonomuraea cavernae]GGO79632.1 hypothetical protein GCM10012289_64370 [Nonomuraea cavernae]